VNLWERYRFYTFQKDAVRHDGCDREIEDAYTPPTCAKIMHGRGWFFMVGVDRVVRLVISLLNLLAALHYLITINQENLQKYIAYLLRPYNSRFHGPLPMGTIAFSMVKRCSRLCYITILSKRE